MHGFLDRSRQRNSDPTFYAPSRLALLDTATQQVEFFLLFHSALSEGKASWKILLTLANEMTAQMSEVMMHNRADSMWLAIDGKVDPTC
jgi:cytochrome b involved in lipid metabolism